MSTLTINKNKWMDSVNSFSFRYAISMGITIVIAMLANQYIAFSQNGWIILAAFLAGQTRRGAPIRQGLIVFFSMSMTILLISSLCKIISKPEAIILLSIVFVICMIISLRWQQQGRNYYSLFVFIITFLVTFPVIQQQNWQNMRMEILDIAIGSIIAILVNQIIFRIRFIQEFRKGMSPILLALIAYANELTKHLIEPTNNKELTKAKIHVEETLVVQHGMYPEWVYEVGFNPGLRSGFRFFLLTIERVIEIFFSLDYLAHRYINPEWTHGLVPAIKQAMEKNVELIQILIAYFAHDQFLNTQSDFTSDIAELEKSLHEIVPGQLELLDISPEFITLTAAVRDIKDLRELLLQLVSALPGTNMSSK